MTTNRTRTHANHRTNALIYLDALEPESATVGWGELQKNRSITKNPITIAGKIYKRGLGAHAPSRILYQLDGAYRKFQALAGADAWTTPTISFEIWTDGKKRWESGAMHREDPPKKIDLDITDSTTLELIVNDTGNTNNADHADWAQAKLIR